MLRVYEVLKGKKLGVVEGSLGCVIPLFDTSGAQYVTTFQLYPPPSTDTTVCFLFIFFLSCRAGKQRPESRTGPAGQNRIWTKPALIPLDLWSEFGWGGRPPLFICGFMASLQTEPYWFSSKSPRPSNIHPLLPISRPLLLPLITFYQWSNIYQITLMNLSLCQGENPDHLGTVFD